MLRDKGIIFSFKCQKPHVTGRGKDEKKWIVIPLVLVLTLIGGLFTIEIWFPFLQRLKPKTEIVIDKATRKEVIDTVLPDLYKAKHS